jgi:membrane-associated PAP2 superfamily phosphatase
MNRIGLIIALAVAAVAGLIFGLWPQLDLAISGRFFDPVKKDFMLRWKPQLGLMRDAAMWGVALVAAVPVIALVAKLILPARKLPLPGRGIVLMLATLVIGPGLIVNVGLKDHWPRSRPIDVPQFNGSEHFTAWWDPGGGCPKNCSFVAGEASGAFWTLAPATIVPPAWRALAYGAALILGIAVGALRLVFGAHFFSDIVFAGVIMFLLIWAAHGLLYRWHTTRITDEAVERAIERIALPPYNAAHAFLSRVAEILRHKGRRA